MPAAVPGTAPGGRAPRGGDRNAGPGGRGGCFLVRLVFCCLDLNIFFCCVFCFVIFFVFCFLFLPFAVREGDGGSFHYNRNRKAGFAASPRQLRACPGGGAPDPREWAGTGATPQRPRWRPPSPSPLLTFRMSVLQGYGGQKWGGPDGGATGNPERRWAGRRA